jgi:hypothetical protein
MSFPFAADQLLQVIPPQFFVSQHLAAASSKVSYPLQLSLAHPDIYVSLTYSAKAHVLSSANTFPIDYLGYLILEFLAFNTQDTSLDEGYGKAYDPCLS